MADIAHVIQHLCKPGHHAWWAFAHHHPSLRQPSGHQSWCRLDCIRQATIGMPSPSTGTSPKVTSSEGGGATILVDSALLLPREKREKNFTSNSQPNAYHSLQLSERFNQVDRGSTARVELSVKGQLKMHQCILRATLPRLRSSTFAKQLFYAN